MNKKVLTLIFKLLPIILFSQPDVALTSVITGLSNPMQTANAGDNTHRIFVVEKGGTIKVFDRNYVFLDTLLRITGIRTSGEQGLLSLAFHPNFRENGYFYIYYTANDPNNGSNQLVVDRYTISVNNQNRANVSSKLTFLNIYHPATNHNGGKINFGKDGFLYISTGDSGGGGDPGNVAQNTSSLLGKMLRLNVDLASMGKNYSLPSGNPYNNEIFALGLRNPFRWNFDRYSGDAYIGDVGQNAREEVSYIPSNQFLGANFGWRCYEGKIDHITTGCGNISQYIAPPYDYQIGSEFGRSVIGGIVYRGYQYPSMKNWYFFIDYYKANMLMVNRNTNNWTTSVKNVGVSNISDFSEREDGEVLVCSNSAGRVYQLTVGSTPMPKTVYVFSGNGSWNNAANWKNGLIPPNPLPSGHDIVIKPYKGGICNINVHQIIPAGSEMIIE
jgi:glucose/arabinose dehydrogenase